MIYAGNGRINEKWSAWLDVQYRNYNFIGDLEQFVVRPAVIYRINERIAVSQGYAYVYSEPYIDEVKTSTVEHRPYQQLQIRDQSGRFFFNHRYRMEERFLEEDFRMRFRYMLWVQVPVNKKLMEKSACYFSAYDEIFFHADKPVFDKNRIYAGLGYVLSPTVRLEIGDMVQMYEKGSRHQLQLMMFHNFDF